MGNLPSNLCSYFWKVLTGILLSILLLPFCAPYYVLDYLTEDFDYYSYKHGYFENGNLAKSFITNILLCCCIGFIGMFFTTWSKVTFFNIFGLIGAFIAIAMFFTWAEEANKWAEWFPRKQKEKPHKTPRPNIFVEFIKAKYNKYCPKIEWKNKDV